MGPPLPAAGTSGIRQARHANSFRMRSCAFGGQNRQPCEGALACRAGPLRKAVRASGSRTCKCSVLLALRRITSSPGAATSRSRRDKRSAPISSEKWASYSQAPPSAGRRAALAAGGSGGPGAGWRGQRRAGAGTGGLARRLVDVQCAALLCVWRPGGRPPGQGVWRFCLPLARWQQKAPYPLPLRLSAWGSHASGPCDTRFTLDALAFPLERPHIGDAPQFWGATQGDGKGTPHPAPHGQSRAPSRRAPARLADHRANARRPPWFCPHPPPQWR
jgi:hypothetical protein